MIADINLKTRQNYRMLTKISQKLMPLEKKTFRRVFLRRTDVIMTCLQEKKGDSERDEFFSTQSTQEECLKIVTLALLSMEIIGNKKLFSLAIKVV